MDKSPEKPGLSAEDLKSHLYQSLHSSGLLKKLKGQLRQNMINELRGRNNQALLKNKTDADLLASTIHKKHPNWILQAIDNLVLLHLKQNRYQYALSLFQQESTVESYSPSLTEDLLERLGLQSRDLDITFETPSSSISEDISNHVTSTPGQKQNDSLTLWVIMEKLSKLAITKPFTKLEKDKSLVEGKSLSLGEKLRAIDEEMQLRTSLAPRDPAIAVSSYSVAVRRAEEDAERRARAAFEQWKSVELLQMKMDETKKARKLVDERLKELEEDYKAKRETLLDRERAAVSRLNNQRETNERDMHEQRQHLLREIDRLQAREDALYKKEKAAHDTEVMQQNELKKLSDQMREADCACLHAGQQTRFKNANVVQQLQMNLAEKSAEILEMKRELINMKTELSSAKLSHIERENVMLRNQLQQAMRGNHEYKFSGFTGLDSQKKMHDEIKRLKDEQLENEAQYRSLVTTMKEMQRALESSNAGVTHLVSTPPRVRFADEQPETSYIKEVSATYTSSPKRDKLRQYEPLQTSLHSALVDSKPLQTSLHPSLVDSGEFNDPSVDERVADATVRLDLQERLKELEIQTDEVNQQYQQYLNTHYKELMEAQCKARTKQATNQEKPEFLGVATRSSNKNENLQKNVLRKEPMLDMFGLDEDPVEIARKHAAQKALNYSFKTVNESPKFDVQYEKLIKDDTSVLIGTSNFPKKSILKTDFEAKENFPTSGIYRSVSPYRSAPDSPKLRNQDSDEDSLSKIFSGRSEEIPTVRKTEENIHGSSRKSSKEEEINQAVILEKNPTSSLKNTLVAKLKEESEHITSAGHSSASNETPAPVSPSYPINKPTNFDEVALPSQSHSIPVNHLTAGNSIQTNEMTRRPSNVSDLSVPSTSIPTDDDVSRKGITTQERNDKEPGSIFSDSMSERRNLVPDIEKHKTPPHLTTDESSISERINPIPKPRNKEQWDGFDISNEDDISAALKWGDESQSRLKSEVNTLKKSAEASVNNPTSVEEKPQEPQVDVFELSEHGGSMDSLTSGKENPAEVVSDVSW